MQLQIELNLIYCRIYLLLIYLYLYLFIYIIFAVAAADLLYLSYRNFAVFMLAVAVFAVNLIWCYFRFDIVLINLMLYLFIWFVLQIWCWIWFCSCCRFIWYLILLCSKLIYLVQLSRARPTSSSPAHFVISCAVQLSSICCPVFDLTCHLYWFPTNRQCPAVPTACCPAVFPILLNLIYELLLQFVCCCHAVCRLYLFDICICMYYLLIRSAQPYPIRLRARNPIRYPISDIATVSIMTYHISDSDCNRSFRTRAAAAPARAHRRYRHTVLIRYLYCASI